MPPFIDALAFTIVLTPIDTLMFSYLFEITDSTKNKREIFYNNIKYIPVYIPKKVYICKLEIKYSRYEHNRIYQRLSG